MRQKGFVKLTLILAVVVALFLLLIFIGGINIGASAAGAFSVEFTSRQLADAIKEVSNCIDTKGSNCRLSVKLNVSLSQGDGGMNPYWTIYHNTKLNSDEKNRDTGFPDGYQAAPPVNELCSDLWKNNGREPGQCADKICYGLIEMANFGSITLEESEMEKVRPFWMVSPCHAEVLVRPKDPSYGCVNCIEICYMGGKNHIPKGDWYGNENFCHYDNNVDWPDESDAWSDLLCS